MNSYYPEFYRKTYEYESNPLNSNYPLNNSNKERLMKTSLVLVLNYLSFQICLNAGQLSRMQITNQ